MFYIQTETETPLLSKVNYQKRFLGKSWYLTQGGGRAVTSSDFARGSPWPHLTTASNLHKKWFENWWIGDGDYQLCSADLWISNTLISHMKSRFRKTLYTLKVSNSGFLFRFCLTNYDWHSTIYNFSDLEKILWTRQAMLRHTHTLALAIIFQ